MDTRVAPKVMHYGLKSIRFTKMVKNWLNPERDLGIMF